MKGFFITGTGTEVGKTFVTAALCHQLKQDGKSVRPLKPVLSGFSKETFPESDTAILLAAAGLDPSDTSIAATSPWRFAAPLAPNMAAAREGRKLDFQEITDFCRSALQGPEDYGLIEGAGGAFSPLTDDSLNINLAKALGIPVLVVSGSYLGAITHAIATVEAIRSRKIPVQCLVISESDINPVPLPELIEILEQYLPEMPVIALPRRHQPDSPWQYVEPIIKAAFGSE